MDFGLEYFEWLHIQFEVFSVDRNFNEPRRQELLDGKAFLSFTPGDAEIERFPLFSRIRNIYTDAVIEAREVASFFTECEQLEKLVSNEKAVAGVEKLRRICRLAAESSRSIVFLGK